MAKKNNIDPAAAKAKKQKIILAVAGVALLGLGVIQGPKLLNGGTSSEPEAAAADATADATAGSATAVRVSTPSGTATVVKVSRPAPTAVLAGVAIRANSAPAVDAGQLVAFTLFDAKDPFVQQDDDGTTSTEGTTTADSTETAPAETPPPTASGGSAPPDTTPAPKPDPIKYATIMLDKKPQQLTVKQKFPQSAPLFVLVSVKSKQAKVGVAGGSFDDGATVTLLQGKQVTLVDTATGVRYVLKLVYTGSAPEQIEGFSTADAQTPAPTTSASATTGSTTSASATP